MDPKDRIIREAAAMFLDEGVKSVRMDDIATRLGVSKRTLYEMFGDKQDLLERSMEWLFEGKRREMCAQVEVATNVIEEIFFMLGSMRRDEKEAALVTNLKKFYPEIYRRLDEETHKYSYKEFDKMLDRGIEQGFFLPSINKELALVTLVYTMHSLFEKKYHFELIKNISHRDAFRYVIVSFFRGLATHKGIEAIDEAVNNYKVKTENRI
ncbi:MAG: TetR/AcrR family transcriptional regulator [Alistipes sp.]|jgi:AcrR family transcriptional regulator|nr:TetR/AcrR family transcriptional regulator [Alistipes sp.]